MGKAKEAVRAGGQDGFATAAVIVLLLVSIVGGAYVLKMTRSQAAASGGYYQARSAALAAQAGLESGIGQLAADPAGGLALLNGYLADSSRQWLLGDSSDADGRTVVDMGNGLQRYAARIVAFDPARAMAKLEGLGWGPGGSESRVYGVYRLGGVEPVRPALARYVWYMAGEARNVDQPVDVWGKVYFGGGVHFNGGADGTIMHGTVKIVRGTGLRSSFDADVIFCEPTWIQTPFRTQGAGVRFCRNAGFDAPLDLETGPRFVDPGATAFLNADITGGHADLDMLGNRVVHGGPLTRSRVVNASAITDNGGAIDIASALGMLPGPESELSVDFSAVPAAFRHSPASLGIAAWGRTDGNELSQAYRDAQAAGRLWRGFLVLDVSTPLALHSAPGNILRGRFAFDVSAAVAVNGNLPVSEASSVSLWHIRSGGMATDFGGPGRFRGYVNVSGTGSVIYRWGAGAEFQGAIHHVSPTAGFQLNGSAGPLKLSFNSGVFDELSTLGVLVAPGTGSPPATPPATPPVAGPPSGPVTPPRTGANRVRLVDVKIRPFLFARWF